MTTRDLDDDQYARVMRSRRAPTCKLLSVSINQSPDGYELADCYEVTALAGDGHPFFGEPADEIYHESGFTDRVLRCDQSSRAGVWCLRWVFGGNSATGFIEWLSGR